MAGIQIQSLPTATTLTGAEQAIVNQGNVTKKTTIDDINVAPLAAASAAQATADSAQTTATSAASAASAAQSTANSASTAASNAQTTANSAATAASNAQTTANGKLSSVTTDSSLSGNGTSGSPLSVVKDYKSYVAVLSQSGTSAPTATVLKNELSGSIVFTYSGLGVYIGTLAGAFIQNKTYATISQTNYQTTAMISFFFPNQDIFQLSVLNSSGGGQNNSLSMAMLEIRVYN